jgi:hypothetical protein
MTTFDTDRARDLVAKGLNWTRASELCGVSVEILRRQFDVGYIEKRRSQRRERHRPIGKVIHHSEFMTAEAKADAERLMDEIPRDTRDLTARLMGDPLPGRRSIDRKPQGAS